MEAFMFKEKVTYFEVSIIGLNTHTVSICDFFLNTWKLIGELGLALLPSQNNSVVISSQAELEWGKISKKPPL